MKKPKTVPKHSRPSLDLTATGRYLRCPPSKACLRARQLKGLTVSRATALLGASPASSARLMLKVLRSAIANALHDPSAASGGSERTIPGLTVESVQVDKASVMKRHHPVSHGAAKPILKRYSHICVRLRYDPVPEGGFPSGRGEVRRRRADPAAGAHDAPSRPSTRAARAAAAKEAKGEAGGTDG
jgi:large subunit ribosomal protein L22